jgi:hypothetical protein
MRYRDSTKGYLATVDLFAQEHAKVFQRAIFVHRFHSQETLFD